MKRSIAKLKEEARNLEQEEAWAEAIQVYQQILQISEEGEDEVELSIYNRIGDLYLRIGKPGDAVRYYEMAADLYEDAGLYNGAIALCNKAIRQDPDRPEPYLKLTRLTLAQGFISEARRWSLEFAERAFRSGGRDAALKALRALADRASAPEIHELIAEVLEARNEAGAAAAQLLAACRLRLAAGDTAAANALRARIVALDPTAALLDRDSSVPVSSAGAASDPAPGVDEFVPELSASVLAEDDDLGAEIPSPTPPLAALDELQLESAADSAGIADLPLLTDLAVETSVEAAPASPPLWEPAVEDDDVAADDIVAPLPLLGLTDSFAEPEPEPPPEPQPEPVVPVLDLETGTIEPVPPAGLAPQRTAPAADQVGGDGFAAGGGVSTEGGFVDLATLVQGEDTVERGATRYTVEAPVPTGDEDRDFLELLHQFRSKVEEHLGEEDADSRYDLGLAFKEMGLYDEAIAQFQLALRGMADPLKVYEELGDCFILKGSYGIALKVLQGALRLSEGQGGKLLGIYYYLGRAYEALGRVDEARDAYERVLALDLEFRDAAERLAKL